MKRICVIGDSHAAALRAGWGHLRTEFPDIDLTFFAAMIQHMEAFRLGEEELIATTDDLRKRMKLTSDGKTLVHNDYDAYLICGLGLKHALVMRVHADLRGKTGITENYFDVTLPAAVEDAVRGTLAMRILNMLQQITGAPILLIPQPAKADDDGVSPDIQSGTLENLRRGLAIFDAACTTLIEKRGASYLPQPRETFAKNGVTTKAAYATAPARLEVTKAGVDRSHMNGAYGAILLRAALRKIA
jgi:hypothetical protein